LAKHQKIRQDDARRFRVSSMVSKWILSRSTDKRKQDFQPSTVSYCLRVQTFTRFESPCGLQICCRMLLDLTHRASMDTGC